MLLVHMYKLHAVFWAQEGSTHQALNSVGVAGHDNMVHTKTYLNAIHIHLVQMVLLPIKIHMSMYSLKVLAHAEASKLFIIIMQLLAVLLQLLGSTCSPYLIL